MCNRVIVGLARSSIAGVGSVWRGVIAGAVVGAVVGLIAGLVVHAIVSSDSALIDYELVAGLLGAIFGIVLGAFYGGALRVPRDEETR